MTTSTYIKGIILSFAMLSLNINATLIVNGSFESDFTGWVTQDLTSPFYALETAVAGETPGFGFFLSSPTDGSLAALHGFDGVGTGTIRISQDITVTSLSTIMFDYRGAWELIEFCGACSLNRTFDVNIEISGGGANLANFNILTAPIHTSVLDTGALTASVNLSAFLGQTVRLNFDWHIPEDMTGPGFFQLDNVRSTATIPEPSTLAIFALGMIGLASRRFQKQS